MSIAISVIIPVFNQEKYVGKCIRSVLDQCFGDFEVIIVNDGSTDKSLMICKRYAKKDARITIIDKQNEGVAYARRDGILKARGEFICFLDSDDYLASDALQVLYELAKKHHVDSVVGNYDKVWDNWGIVKKKAAPYSKEITDRLIGSTELLPMMLGIGSKEYLFGIAIWRRLYRRECVIKANEVNPDMLFPKLEFQFEDDLFNLAITPFLQSVWLTNAIVYHYRFGGITSRDVPAIRYGGFIIDERYAQIVKLGCCSALPLLFERYVALLCWDVSNQIHFQSHNEKEIRCFLSEELAVRKIVLWARQQSSELLNDMRNDSFSLYVLNGDVNAFLSAVYERERFLKKHHYWKMRILKNYQRMVDVIR